MHTNAAEQTVHPIWHKPSKKSGYILQIQVWTEALEGIRRGEKCGERGLVEIYLKIIRESTHFNISLPSISARAIHSVEREVRHKTLGADYDVEEHAMKEQDVMTEDICLCS